MTRRRITALFAAVLALLVAGGVALVVRNTANRPTTITAYFTAATAIYPGDEVRVAGVKVGKVTAIDPEGTKAKLMLAVNRDVPIPADAKAVIVVSNLVGARYVQLAPAHGADGDSTRPIGLGALALLMIGIGLAIIALRPDRHRRPPRTSHHSR